MTTARARIHAMFTLDETAEAELDTRLDTHRVENRREAADWLATYPFPPARTDWERGRNEGVAWSAGILRDPDPRRPDGDASGAPDFFQRGRTYARDEGGTRTDPFVWVFEVRCIETHPDGTRYAFGFLTSKGGGNSLVPHSEWEGSWPDGWTSSGWTDVTPGAPRG